MSTVTNGQKTALPSSMEHKLRTIQKRLIGRVVLRALAVGGSALILAMIVCMIVDWALMLFDPAVRISLTAGALLTALAAFLWVGYRPLVNALGWADAARRVDDETPLLEERWTTVLTFREQDLHPGNSTARAMLQHVTSEAVAMETLVEPKTVTRFISPRRALLTLAGCLLFCAAFLATDWPQTSILLQRFWNPAANITATQLASTSGDLTIPRGETVDLAAKLSGLPREEAQLTVKYESGINEVFPLESDEETPQQFLHTLRVNESFEYQLTAGDGRTAWHSVTAIDYPLLDQISFRVIPPSYLERSVYEKSWIPSRVKVAQGSVLELRMQPDIPLQKFDLQLVHHPEDGEPISETLTLHPGKDGTYVFDLALWNNLSFEPKLLSLHDLSNESKHVCRIEVIPDLAPIARVITPNDQTSVADDDVVKIEFEAHDDHGIETAELVIYDESTREEGKEPEILETRPIDLKEQAHQKHVMAETELDLKELGLQPGQQISLSVRVTDNRKMTAEEKEQIASITRELKQKMAQQTEDSSNERATKMSEESGDSQESAADQQQMIAANQKTEGENPTPPAESDEQPLLARRETNPTSPAKSSPDAQPSGKPSESESTGDPETSENTRDSETGVAEASEENPDGDMNSQEESDTDVAEAADEEKAPGKSPADVAEGSEPNDPSENSKATEPAENSVAGKDGRDRKTEDAGDQPAGVAESTDDGKNPTDIEKSEEDTPGEQVAANDNSDPGAVETESPGTNQPAGEDAPNNSGDDDAAVANSESPETTEQEASETAPLPPGNPQEEQTAQKKSPQGNPSVADSSTTGKSNPPDDQPENQPQESSIESVPLDKLLALSPQQNDGGQNVESNRKKLKITKRLASVTEKVKERTPKSNIRDRVVAVDKQLAVVETGLQRLLKREIPDADREEQFQRLDRELLSIEENIAGIRDDTRETQFAFVGLQIVEIGRFHVTPARDRVFTAMQTPVGSDSNTSKSLHHVERARELLAALLNRYDEVVQEDKLKKALKETVKMYEIYIDKAHKLMREARQNKHPLDRKMAVIEVDQAYLDRRAEVETLRREIHAEFARMLADDPRLASRYLDLIKRRRETLLEQLSELTDRQEDLTTEVSGWLAVDEAQRTDLWSLIVDMRLQSADQLASETAEFSEQMVKSLPLSLDADRGTAAATIRFAENAAQIAREISFETRNLYGNADRPSLEKLSRRTAQLLTRLRQIERALDRLTFEHDEAGADGDVNEVVEYASARLVELQTVADRANDWNETLQHILKDEYPPIASNDQQRVAIATELLRVNLLSMETQLQGQFERAAQLAGEEGDVSLPQEVKNLVYELQRVMEGITLNQAAATYSLSVPDLNDAELQQYKALEGFRQAEDLFLKIRRAVVKHLDEYDVPDPTADQLRDPTLDQFLADLEREPNIEQQLGIPNRPQNLRVIADSMQWQQTGGDFLSESMQAAAARMQKAMKKQEMEQARREPKDEEDKEKPDTPTNLRDLEEMIRRSVARLEEKMEEDQLSAAERRKLEAMKENMKRFLNESSDQPSAEQLWRKIAESDQAAAILKAMARGEAVPDQQWNKILSTLNEGLWQMRGRTPPEEYRKSIEQYQEQFRKLVDGPGAGQSSSSSNENLR